MHPDLPIQKIQARFLQALEHKHVVVQSPTGSGKSTLLPLWCGNRAKVLVIEPRRLACQTLARYLASITKTEIGDHIGYAVRFEACYSPQSQVVFVTPGIALRWLADTGLKQFQTIILDEFHERRWDTDLIAALLKHHIQKPDPRRIVITSATVDGKALATYLNGDLLYADGHSYPVELRYTEQRELPQVQGLEKKVCDAVLELQQYEGDILVFLPGRGEIQTCLDSLSRLNKQLDSEIIPLHASVDSKTQTKAMQVCERRRIILATNVAETSLTIPGVTMVIDSGLERRTHHRNGRTVLGLHCISQAAAEQRKGRAGRLSAGLCLRLWGRQARLEAFTPPETQREELTELVLAAAAAGADVHDLSFPNPLPSHAIQRACKQLTDMGALTSQGHLSAHGKKLFPLPLDPLFAHLISVMPDPYLMGIMIQVAAALTPGRALMQSLKTEEQQKSLKQWVNEDCDLATLIKLMCEKPPQTLPINHTVLKEARKIAKQTCQALGVEANKLIENFQREQFLEAVVKACPDLLYVRRNKRHKALGNGLSEVELGRESRFNESAQAAVVFDQFHAPGKGTKNTVNRAIMMAPVSLDFIDRLGLGEIQHSNPRWENNCLSCTRQRIYAGKVVKEQEVYPEGSDACEAISFLILNGRIPGLSGKTLTSDIEAYNLYNTLNKTKIDPLNPDAWLTQQLLSLGVQQGSDLELIQQQDLSFPGIPEWERHDFDRKFPTEVSLSNLTMKVQYDAVKKLVTLIKQDGSRKTAPQQKELPLWSGWSVRFKDASRVIQIK